MWDALALGLHTQFPGRLDPRLLDALAHVQHIAFFHAESGKACNLHVTLAHAVDPLSQRHGFYGAAPCLDENRRLRETAIDLVVASINHWACLVSQA
jgi:hypothetical protein